MQLACQITVDKYQNSTIWERRARKKPFRTVWANYIKVIKLCILFSQRPHLMRFCRGWGNLIPLRKEPHCNFSSAFCLSVFSSWIISQCFIKNKYTRLLFDGTTEFSVLFEVVYHADTLLTEAWELIRLNLSLPFIWKGVNCRLYANIHKQNGWLESPANSTDAYLVNNVLKQVFTSWTN